MKTLVNIRYNDGSFTLYSFYADFESLPPLYTVIEADYKDKIVMAKVQNIKHRFEIDSPFENNKPTMITIFADRYDERKVTKEEKK